MGTFDEQTETVDVPTVMDITRFEFLVNKSHLVEQDVVEDGEVVGSEMVDDGGPDLDIYVYVGGERTADRRQVPRDKVIAGWPGGLKAELLKIFNHAQ
jgi:hypothetical protein